MQSRPVQLPFRPQPKPDWPFRKPAEIKATDTRSLEEKQEAWVDSIKFLARQNLENDKQAMRIAWQNRFKKSTHEKFEDYTPEELLLESWEQFFYENPDHRETHGLSKLKSKKTGKTYFKSGSKQIDDLEAAFARGEAPDLNAVDWGIKESQDIFRAPVFYKEGEEAPVTPLQGPETFVKNAAGQYSDGMGNEVEYSDFKNDDWLLEAMGKDDTLSRLQEKFGVTNGKRESE
jgi:hypothetical protein